MNDNQSKTESLASVSSTPLLSCHNFQEHKDWMVKHPLGPVTWDGWCSSCGFRIEDARFDDGEGVGISGNGRRLAACTSRRIIGGKLFTSNETKIYCSSCVPSIL